MSNFELFKSKLNFLDFRITKMLKKINRHKLVVLSEELEYYLNQYKIPIKVLYKRNNSNIESVIDEISDSSRNLVVYTKREIKLAKTIKKLTRSRIEDISIYGDSEKTYISTMITITKKLEKLLRY